MFSVDFAFSRHPRDWLPTASMAGVLSFILFVVLFIG